MRKKASDPKTFWGPVPDRDAILNLEPVILLEDAEDYFGRDYHGDSFDERLCQIYTMPESEAREVIDQLVRVWGHQLRLPHVDDAIDTVPDDFNYERV
ncbi:uncharacterized protein LAJ45_08780 [Morchella importuna]|uniref:uncharacterized protein n=1 Tax=Morchella importuna TaxID=1174673 RepID=UPI001E8E1097|nr:uncharacterized protein LAJ45_08780 [Morchella importuna]KAH8147302.1 hypothetical protein LAJ45_08780 [Morchella importuna]